MTFRRAYFALAIVFYASIPAVFFAEEIGFLVCGHSLYDDDALQGSPVLQGMYYDAYNDSAGVIMALARTGMLVWVAALAASLYAATRPGQLPFRLGLVTGIVSGFLVFIAIPAAMIGHKLALGALM